MRAVGEAEIWVPSEIAPNGNMDGATVRKKFLGLRDLKIALAFAVASAKNLLENHGKPDIVKSETNFDTDEHERGEWAEEPAGWRSTKEGAHYPIDKDGKEIPPKGYTRGIDGLWRSDKLQSDMYGKKFKRKTLFLPRASYAQVLSEINDSFESLYEGKAICWHGTYDEESKTYTEYAFEKLSQKMNSIWTAFGNLLGPIIERLIGWVTSAVSYLLSFLKLLGVTSKTASQLSKSTKKGSGDLQKTVAGFDELNKLQQNNGDNSATLDDKDPTSWMQKIQELISGKKWEQLGEEIGRKITEFITSIPQKISALIKSVDWKEVGRAVVGIIKGLFDGISIRDIMDSLVKLAHDIWNAFLDALWGALDDGSGKEPPIVESLRNLGDAIERLYNTIMDHWEQDIKPLFKDAFFTEGGYRNERRCAEC